MDFSQEFVKLLLIIFFLYVDRGVFQTLVEKHFPAPDRDRINRLLGLEPPRTKAAPSHQPVHTQNGKNGLDDEANTSKRKLTARQQANAAAKRMRGGSSSDEFVRGSDDELEMESDDERRPPGSDSDLSDFNPFHGGSDSDDEPWLGRQKKKPVKKKKAASPKKKPSTTQDKIETMFERKNSAAATPTVTVTTPAGHSLTGTPVGTNGLYLGPSRAAAPPRSAIERACSMKEELLSAIERLGRRLPPNTLDQLVDELGGTDNVAEMTGRKGRVVQTEDGQILYESRSEADVPLETLNLTEKQRFMDGQKDVAIISEAASSGISLQSDRRSVELYEVLFEKLNKSAKPKAEGRTHRSNQVNAPEYIFLISDLAGERRFASTVAKRLESLGALTHGDRRATETRDLSQFNIDNKYGRAALEAVMRAIMKYERPLVAPPADYAADFFQDAAAALVGVGLIVNSEAAPGVLQLDKDYNNMSKFLNRILGMPVDLQNRLFNGRFDLGILDLGSCGERVRRVRCMRYVRRHATGRAPVELHTLHSEVHTLRYTHSDIPSSLLRRHATGRAPVELHTLHSEVRTLRYTHSDIPSSLLRRHATGRAPVELHTLHSEVRTLTYTHSDIPSSLLRRHATGRAPVELHTLHSEVRTLTYTHSDIPSSLLRRHATGRARRTTHAALEVRTLRYTHSDIPSSLLRRHATGRAPVELHTLHSEVRTLRYTHSDIPSSLLRRHATGRAPVELHTLHSEVRTLTYTHSDIPSSLLRRHATGRAPVELHTLHSEVRTLTYTHSDIPSSLLRRHATGRAPVELHTLHSEVRTLTYTHSDIPSSLLRRHATGRAPVELHTLHSEVRTLRYTHSDIPSSLLRRHATGRAPVELHTLHSEVRTLTYTHSDIPSSLLRRHATGRAPVELHTLHSEVRTLTYTHSDIPSSLLRRHATGRAPVELHTLHSEVRTLTYTHSDIPSSLLRRHATGRAPVELHTLHSEVRTLRYTHSDIPSSLLRRHATGRAPVELHTLHSEVRTLRYTHSDIPSSLLRRHATGRAPVELHTLHSEVRTLTYTHSDIPSSLLRRHATGRAPVELHTLHSEVRTLTYTHSDIPSSLLRRHATGRAPVELHTLHSEVRTLTYTHSDIPSSLLRRHATGRAPVETTRCTPRYALSHTHTLTYLAPSCAATPPDAPVELHTLHSEVRTLTYTHSDIPSSLLRRHATGRAPVELHTLHSERGMDWAEALEKWSELSGAKEGFYVSQQARNNKYTAILCVAAVTSVKKEKLTKKDIMPNTGLQLKLESLAEIEKKYRRVESSEAESWWRAQYTASQRVCSHAYWRSLCRNGADCEVGLRVRTHHVLSGSVLAVWARVEAVLAARAQAHKMQVVRLKAADGLKLVGTLIPKNCVEPLKEALCSDAVSVSEHSFEHTELN
ncbi:hypothetical protein HF086_003058 [Spodoptera exigua]|uniref:Strawberry notch helicase C domain-containing protein n=1 Tax=Spodoptera exigua TaxID=7107 RepID=A0A922MQA0_SPOEX|nr:hypothetical protein HF086_003058 [Spodoptera exigua]